MEDDELKPVLEMVRWVNDNYVNIVDAFAGKAARCEHYARSGEVTNPRVASSLAQGALDWRASADRFRELWRALPDSVLS